MPSHRWCLVTPWAFHTMGIIPDGSLMTVSRIYNCCYKYHHNISEEVMPLDVQDTASTSIACVLQKTV
jgi:hypothetical protein